LSKKISKHNWQIDPKPCKQTLIKHDKKT
jgi:hypothetical protein